MKKIQSTKTTIKPIIKPTKKSIQKKFYRKQVVKEISATLDDGIDAIRFTEKKEFKNYFKKKDTTIDNELNNTIDLFGLM